MAIDRRYSASTVVLAQRRVLRMAADIIGSLPQRQITSLRAGQRHFASFDEVLHHIDEALKLKVKRT